MYLDSEEENAFVARVKMKMREKDRHGGHLHEADPRLVKADP